jgi:Rps23 Pro-64 3,4-dihydroxylase Tpa1-like proline 4-hydroxylase
MAKNEICAKQAPGMRSMIVETQYTPYGFFDPQIATAGEQFRADYTSAKPFPHIVLDNFLDEEILELCQREFPDSSASRNSYARSQENLKFEFNPESLSPPLRSLFQSFNSRPFIKFLENLTGIQGLIPDPHFAGGGLHEVARGGYLNIHADFNYHELMGLERRLNVLIYLNKDWKEEYGGCFEIWDQQMRSCCRRVLPLFNRCVVFNTSSTSFHGNPQPVNHPAGASRRSIALYYYTATWDGTRRAHTTQFKVRPNSTDAFDVGVRAQEVLADITPPILFRVVTRVTRAARRQLLRANPSS